MTPRRPVLVRFARYRWDELRRQHQLVFPEGLLVLNASAAAVVTRCDGRPIEDIVAELAGSAGGAGGVALDVAEFLDRLARRGLLDDAANA